MAWISAREIRRLERELARANKRADDAEDRLAIERQSKDWLTVQLASRLATKAGTYGLEDKPPKPVELKAHPKGYLREPDEVDTAKLEYYKKCFSDAGKSEIEAERFWEAEMRGEAPTIEAEQEQ
jgi:hypothetical protein